jgi:hypothetical protein
LAAFGAGALDDVLPFVGPQRDGCEDGRGNRNCVGRESEHELDRELGPGHGPGGSCSDLRIDHNRVAANLKQRKLGGWRGEIVGASEQFNELTPADGTVMRIGCRLRQHRVQAIVETHRGIRFLQDRSIPDLVVRAPTEGVVP